MSAPDPALSELFLAACAGPFPAASLAEDLASRITLARQAWPALAVDDAAFVRHLARHAGEADLPPVENAAELFLACACAENVAGAAAAFGAAYRPILERAVARVDRGSVEEGVQIVLVSLLVGEPPDPPRIATYAGRSTLRAWLATVATRATLKLHRRRDDQPHDSVGGLVDAFVAEAPEIALAKARHGPDLAAAFVAALGALEPRARVLLQLHHARGWSVDRIGAFYRVGRSTAARWVAAARDALLEGAKGRLKAQLDLTTTEMESLVALLRSNVELSLLRMLDDDGAPSDRSPG
jgi:RNA polymerase sigma-70 factor (ECF subfamily)